MAGTTPRRMCTSCDTRFRTPVGDPNQELCGPCRGSSPRVVSLPRPADEPEQPAPPATVHASTLETLRNVQRESTPLGVAALKLAAELDEAKGVAAARISTEWAKVFDLAMDGAVAEVDVVDQIFGATGT